MIADIDTEQLYQMKLCCLLHGFEISFMTPHVIVINPMVFSCYLSQFLGWEKQPSRGVLKKCSKFTGKHPCRSVLSIKLQSKFIESHFGVGVLLYICCIFLEHLFPKNTSGGLLEWINCSGFLSLSFYARYKTYCFLLLLLFRNTLNIC